MSRSWLVLSSLSASLLLLSACGDGEEIPDAEIMLIDSGDGTTDAGPGFLDGSGIGNSEFVLDRVVPNVGPTIGGNTVVLRGNGFTDLAQVTFGGRNVQPADHRLIDERRLAVVVPPGEVGPVDVTIEVDGETRELEDAYTYEPIYVEPNSGSIAGGTFVSIVGTGTTFEDGDTVNFGRLPCTDIEVVSETRINCRTPPSVAGTVDVAVIDGVDASETSAQDAFTYFDNSDPFSGGLGGGPIAGAINITAIDTMTGLPVPDAFAIVGEDLTTVHQGLTDTLGQITFSGPDIMAPATVHVAKFCYERTSVIAFDASQVTVFMQPWIDPMCGMGMGEPPPPGRGRNGATVAGELVFFGPMEMGPNPWSNVPEPIDGWVRSAYVYSTRVRHDIPNVDPSGNGTQMNRVLEDGPTGTLGYPYSIFVRPAGMAVYALAGLENTVTGEFRPYVMGVARNVLAGPAQTVTGVDIIMNIPLDHYLETEITGLPSTVTGGPDRFRMQADIDLGGEGVIHRMQPPFQIDPRLLLIGEEMDVLRLRDVSRNPRFTAQPSLEGALSDGRYRVEVGWYTSDGDFPPYTVAIERGVTTIDATLPINGFLGIPEPVAPVAGGTVPSDRIFRWSVDPTAPEPSLYMIVMLRPGSLVPALPVWRMMVPGNITQVPVPDFGSIEGLGDIGTGFITWGVFAISIDGFMFDNLRYSDLNGNNWEREALDTWVFQR